jgi:voltage-gated potassium channel
MAADATEYDCRALARTTDRLLRRLATPLAGVALVYVAGVAGWMAFGLGFVDALTQTSLTMTTVGLAVGHELTTGEKLFSIFLAVGGVSVFLAFLAVLSGAIAEGQITIGNRRRRMDRRIAELRDHYILCAYGRVGRAVARELEAEGVPLVVIDQKDELEDLMRYDGVLHIIGDPTRSATLHQAGIERARALVCAVDSDADSVYITLTARSINPDIFIVARAGEPESADRLTRAGANRIVSPYVTSGRHMALLAVRPRMVDYVDVATVGDGTLRLEEVLIEEGSPLVGRPLGEAAAGGLALLLRRAGGEAVANPNPGERLAAGDLVVVLAESGARERPRV